MTEIAAKLKEFLKSHPKINSFAINTPTDDDAQLVVGALFELGFPWDVENPESTKYREDGKFNTRWEKNREKTCYTVGVNPNQIFYCNRKFYEKRGREIYDLSDVEKIDIPDKDNDLFSSIPKDNMDENADIEKNIADEESKNDRKKNTNVSESHNKSYEGNNNITKLEIPLDNQSELVCPYCGNKIKNGSKFCPECGQKIVITDIKSTIPVGHINKSNLNEKDTAVDPVPVNQDNTESEAMEKYNLHQELHDDNKIANDENDVTSKQDDKTLVRDKLDDNIKIEDTDNRLPLLKLLDVDINQEFHVIPNDYFNTKNIYRINENGYREIKVGDGIWFISNNEQDLIYLINHPNEIQII